MLGIFYLSGEDYITEPDAQTCRLLKRAETKYHQPLLDVEITPPLPGRLALKDSEITRLLLGFANPANALEDIGKCDVCVDIYVPQSDASQDVYDPKELIKIGLGGLYSSLEDALDASSRTKIKLYGA